MQVAVIHHIKDSDGFYSTVEEALKDGPPDNEYIEARYVGIPAP